MSDKDVKVIPYISPTDEELKLLTEVADKIRADLKARIAAEMEKIDDTNISGPVIVYVPDPATLTDVPVPIKARCTPSNSEIEHLLIRS